MIEFWFEFASTYSYPAAMRVEEVAQRAGESVAWRPFLLAPIFNAQGWNDSPFNIYPAKGRYMWRDMERICADLAIPLRKPSRFPRSGLLAARICCAAANEAWLPQFVRSVYSANFANDREISEPAVLRDCLSPLTQDADRWLAAADSDAVKLRLRQNTERATALGFVGAPTFVAGDEVFWGSDRLETALAWSKTHSAG